MPNAENLTIVADHIEAHPESFDIKTPLTDCHSTGCVAGLSAALCAPEALQVCRVRRGRYSWLTRVDLEGSVPGIFDIGREALGLTRDEAQALFHGAWRDESNDVMDHTASECVRVIRGIVSGAFELVDRDDRGIWWVEKEVA